MSQTTFHQILALAKERIEEKIEHTSNQLGEALDNDNEWASAQLIQRIGLQRKVKHDIVVLLSAISPTEFDSEN